MFQTLAKSVLGTVLGLTVLAACSAKVDGTDPLTTVKPQEKKEIAGPDLTGVWASMCNPQAFGGSKKITMVIKDKQVSRVTENFTDGKCEAPAKVKGADGILRDETSTLNGTFIFQEKYADDIYKVQYSFDLGRGTTSLTPENLRRDGRTLWISEFFIGETIIPQTPLALISDVK